VKDLRRHVAGDITCAFEMSTRPCRGGFRIAVQHGRGNCAVFDD
jgi:hypothetical protein